MERLLCLAVGYIFGLFQTGFIYGRSHGIDIRNYGSGNSGTTNALRVLGVKAGLIVFIGDFLKTVIPCLIARYLLGGQEGMGYVYMLYAGFGVILGHNFPFYLGFKGGKGIAATAGIIFSIDWRLTVICLSCFILLVAVTRYVSLGSLVVSVILLVWDAVQNLRGAYGLIPGRLEFTAVTAVITVMAFWRHRANIGRLLKGTENKVGAKKQ